MDTHAIKLFSGFNDLLRENKKGEKDGKDG
jgi:hypothetical protein